MRNSRTTFAQIHTFYFVPFTLSIFPCLLSTCLVNYAFLFVLNHHFRVGWGYCTSLALFQLGFPKNKDFLLHNHCNCLPQPKIIMSHPLIIAGKEISIYLEGPARCQVVHQGSYLVAFHLLNRSVESIFSPSFTDPMENSVHGWQIVTGSRDIALSLVCPPSWPQCLQSIKHEPGWVCPERSPGHVSLCIPVRLSSQLFSGTMAAVIGGQWSW